MTDKEKAQRQIATAKYLSTHKKYTFHLNETEDADMITWLENHSNKSEVIRQTLRKGFEL